MTEPARIRRFDQGRRAFVETPEGMHQICVSLTVIGETLVYANVGCPLCGWWVMAIPGPARFLVRAPHNKADRTGGRIALCRHCGNEVEVIEE